MRSSRRSGSSSSASRSPTRRSTSYCASPDALSGGDARHFAILGVRDPDKDVALRRRLNQKYDIEPIPINNSRGKVDRAFRDIVKEIAGGKPTGPARERKSDPADPNKGMFGRSASRGGRQLSATVTEAPDTRDWYRVELVVRPTDGKKIKGMVTFHLHPTFEPSRYSVRANEEGFVHDTIWSWGAFTVGATIKEGSKTTRLELDLAQIPSAPTKFKQR